MIISLPADDMRLQSIADDTRQRMAAIGEHMVTIGSNLIEAKSLLPRGAWLPWLDTEFGMSARTAQYLMRVARVWGEKNANLAYFTRSALYELSSRDVDEDARAAAAQLAAQGQKVNARTAAILTCESEEIKARFARREITIEQAEGLLRVLPRIRSPLVRRLAETRITDPEVVETLDALDADTVEVIAATGHLQSGEVIPAEKLTARDLERHAQDEAREAMLAKIAATRRTICYSKAAFVTGLDPENGTVTLKIGDLVNELGEGEQVYLTIETRI